MANIGRFYQLVPDPDQESDGAGADSSSQGSHRGTKRGSDDFDDDDYDEYDDSSESSSSSDSKRHRANYHLEMPVTDPQAGPPIHNPELFDNIQRIARASGAYTGPGANVVINYEPYEPEEPLRTSPSFSPIESVRDREASGHDRGPSDAESLQRPPVSPLTEREVSSDQENRAGIDASEWSRRTQQIEAQNLAALAAAAERVISTPSTIRLEAPESSPADPRQQQRNPLPSQPSQAPATGVGHLPGPEESQSQEEGNSDFYCGRQEPPRPGRSRLSPTPGLQRIGRRTLLEAFPRVHNFRRMRTWAGKRIRQPSIRRLSTPVNLLPFPGLTRPFRRNVQLQSTPTPVTRRSPSSPIHPVQASYQSRDTPIPSIEGPDGYYVSPTSAQQMSPPAIHVPVTEASGAPAVRGAPRRGPRIRIGPPRGRSNAQRVPATQRPQQTSVDSATLPSTTVTGTLQPTEAARGAPRRRARTRPGPPPGRRNPRLAPQPATPPPPPPPPREASPTSPARSVVAKSEPVSSPTAESQAPQKDGRAESQASQTNIKVEPVSSPIAESQAPAQAPAPAPEIDGNATGNTANVGVKRVPAAQNQASAEGQALARAAPAVPATTRVTRAMARKMAEAAAAAVAAAEAPEAPAAEEEEVAPAPKATKGKGKGKAKAPAKGAAKAPAKRTAKGTTKATKVAKPAPKKGGKKK